MIKNSDLKNHPDIIKLKIKQKEEIHEFANENIFWAYNEKAFDEGMRKLGLDPNKDCNKIIGIAGGAIRRDKVLAYKEMIKRQEKELKDLKKTLRET